METDEVRGRPLDSFACTPMLLVGYVSWGDGVGDFSPIGLVCGFQRALRSPSGLLRVHAHAAGWVMLVGGRKGSLTKNFQYKSSSMEVCTRRGGGGDRKAPSSLPQERNPCDKQNQYNRKQSSRQTGGSPPAVTALLHRRRFHMHNHLCGDVLVQAHLNLHIADGADVLALDVALVHRNAVLRLQLLGNFRARNRAV